MKPIKFEVEELAIELWSIFDVINTLRKWHELSDESKEYYYARARHLMSHGYTKRPQDNNSEEGETKNDIAWQDGYKAGVDACNPGGTIVNLRGLVPLEWDKVAEVVSQIIPTQQTTVIEQIANRICAKFGKDNNALVPLDELLVAKELHWIEGINSNPKLRERPWEICHEKSDYIQRAKMLCAKFGKDNSGMVPISDELIKHYESKETK